MLLISQSNIYRKETTIPFQHDLFEKHAFFALLFTIENIYMNFMHMKYYYQDWNYVIR